VFYSVSSHLHNDAKSSFAVSKNETVLALLRVYSTWFQWRMVDIGDSAGHAQRLSMRESSISRKSLEIVCIMEPSTCSWVTYLPFFKWIIIETMTWTLFTQCLKTRLWHLFSCVQYSTSNSKTLSYRKFRSMLYIQIKDHLIFWKSRTMQLFYSHSPE